MAAQTRSADDNDPGDLVALARVDARRALRRIDALLSMPPADPDARAELWAHRSFAELQLQDPQGAARSAANAMQTAAGGVRPPTEALARLSLAQVLRSIGVPDLACAELRDTLSRLGPLPARLATRIRAELASGCRQLGLRDEAAALFDAICGDADALPPEEAAVYRINAASAWWQVGRLDQARAALADARRDLGPAGPAPLRGWTDAIEAWIARARGDHARARALVDRATELAGDDLGLRASAARVALARDPSGPISEPEDRLRATALLERAIRDGHLAVARELAADLAADANARGDAMAEASALRQQRAVAEKLSRDAELLHGANSEARALLLAANAESDALRAQAASLAEANARLTALAASRARLVSALAHDLRGPLTALTLGLDLLHVPEQGALLAEIKSTTSLLARIIDTALDEGDLRRAVHRATEPPAAVGPVLEQAIAAHRLPALQRGVTITRACDAPETVIIGVGAVRRILHNLLSNAVRYTRPDSALTVRASNDGVALTLTIDDQGEGFGDIDRSALLMDRVRARGAACAGHGIGLHTVHLLVESLGGTLTLGDAPGGGASVRVRLPVIATPVGE